MRMLRLWGMGDGDVHANIENVSIGVDTIVRLNGWRKG